MAPAAAPQPERKLAKRKISPRTSELKNAAFQFQRRTSVSTGCKNSLRSAAPGVIEKRLAKTFFKKMSNAHRTRENAVWCWFQPGFSRSSACYCHLHVTQGRNTLVRASWLASAM